MHRSACGSCPCTSYTCSTTHVYTVPENDDVPTRCQPDPMACDCEEVASSHGLHDHAWSGGKRNKELPYTWVDSCACGRLPPAHTHMNHTWLDGFSLAPSCKDKRVCGNQVYLERFSAYVLQRCELFGLSLTRVCSIALRAAQAAALPTGPVGSRRVSTLPTGHSSGASWPDGQRQTKSATSLALS